jgi:hypothetical protein
MPRCNTNGHARERSATRYESVLHNWEMPPASAGADQRE